MKKRKGFYLILAMLLAFSIVFGSMNSASRVEAEESEFYIDEDGRLLAYYGDGGEIIIPNGVKVIEWGTFANDESITSVIIPNSVEKIGREAFGWCTSLTSVVIPESVTIIDEGAFTGCSSLTSVTIPKTVKSIGSEAFFWCTSLTEVIISNGVQSIGDRAFSRTAITDIALPATVTSMGYDVFSICESLKEVIIQDGATMIGSDAFSSCTNLTKVIIPDSVMRIEGGAFSGCISLKEVHIPSSLTNIENCVFSGCKSMNTIAIPNSVTSIGVGAFSDCEALTDVVIPDSVTNIGKFAFQRCISLTEVNIPKSVETIENGAFYGTGIEELYFENRLLAYHGTSDNYTVKVGTEKIDDGAFMGNQVLKNVTLPSTVKIIGEYAFDDCCSLTSVEIPNGVTVIGHAVFSGCSELKDVRIPDSVTEIGAYAFSQCKSLETIHIPNSVTSIGYHAFEMCDGLICIVIPTSVIDISETALAWAYHVTIKCEANSVAQKCAEDNEIPYIIAEHNELYLPTITKQPENVATNDGSGNVRFVVETFEKDLFYQWYWRRNASSEWGLCGFTGSKTATMEVPAISARNGFQYRCEIKDKYGKIVYSEPATLTVGDLSPAELGFVIEDGVLTKYEGNAENIVIPDSVTEIGEHAFEYNRTIKKIVIPGTVKGIGVCAFSDCRNLQEIEIQYGVESIGREAFYHCSSLVTLEIPDSVKVIEWGAFRYCDGLTSIKLSKNLKEIKERAFCGCIKLKNVEIPMGIVSIEEGVFQECRDLETIVIPESITTIQSRAFALCKNLKNVKIPEKVECIGDYAFASCDQLSVIYIPESVVQFGSNIFNNNNTTVYGKRGSSAEKYAKENEIPFVAVNLEISKQPTNQTATSGPVKFSVSATGVGLTYQWYWRKNISSAWSVTGFTGSKSATMIVEAIAARNGFQYRCEIKDKYGDVVYSEPVTLYYAEKAAITKQPDDITVASGNVKFTVAATGDGLTYQWYWRRNTLNEWGVCGFTGAKTATMQVPVISSRNGFQYRCEVKDKYGNVVYSNPATLTVAATNKAVITKQPVNQTAKTGNAVFTVGATGDGLTYQWYWRKNAASEWGIAGFTGAKTASMQVPVISSRNGFQYRCEVKDKYGNVVYSEPATLYYGSKATITKQPVNINIAAGKTATFSLTATGDGLTYQWYWRKNSSSEWGICGFTGARTASMQVPAITARNGYQYQCVVKDKYGNTVTSTAVTFTVTQ